MALQKLCIWVALLLSVKPPAISQVTTGSVSGKVTAIGGERMSGATVKIIHEPTGTVSFTQTNRQGMFMIENLNPGGPYTVEASFLNFNNGRKTGLEIRLGAKTETELRLEPKFAQLKQVMVSSTRKTNSLFRNDRSIGAEKIEALPSINRNLQDYLLAAPHSKTVSDHEGAVSFAGQNNRYNAFNIDGAVNNDVFGLAASGTNGGQTGISPLSPDAIEQLQVSVSPYDASIGNFTGAAVNAVTRSGTNRQQVSVYHYFSNGLLRGNLPVVNDSQAAIKPVFFKRIYGMRIQGPIQKNRLFYFINVEMQREKYTQPSLLGEYLGDTRDPKQLQVLYNHLISNYQYNAGSFEDITSLVFADRLVARFDWNLNPRHNITASFRYLQGQRIYGNTGDAENLHFGNNGYILFTRTLSGSAEWKSRIGRKMGNRLLVTWSDIKDDRAPNGNPFPRVRIYDGDGSIVFGTDNSSTVNLLTQQNWVLADKWYGNLGRHNWSVGIDASYSEIYNAFIQNAFGNYTYSSVIDFVRGRRPSGYQLGFSLLDSLPGDRIHAGARILMLRGAFFLNDEYRAGTGLIVQAGLRADIHSFPIPPEANHHVNDTALPAFSRYYDLEAARSGAKIRIPMGFSPRLGIVFTSPSGNWVLRGGMGIFTGRMPLAWPGGVYQFNGSHTGGYQLTGSQLNRLSFRPDPYRQWTTNELGIPTNKDPLNLVAGKLYMPSLARVSLGVDKTFSKNWALSLELILSKNLKELSYTNINLLPATARSQTPDSRSVYTDSNQARIPLQPDGSNPYGYAILLSNHSNKGSTAINISINLRKQIDNLLNFECSYNFGSATSMQDGTHSVNLNQWRMTETVHGRNSVVRSVSDFSSGHRIYAWLNRKLILNHRKLIISFSTIYNGQSGFPFSYVYSGGTMVRDDGKTGGYELIYVPTPAELSSMLFLPFTIENTLFTTGQQKQALEEYISQDKYLQKRRGQYAERNGSRTPFTHVVDIKITTDISFKINKNNYRIQILFDILNLGNLLSKTWGHRYFQPFDKMELLEFAGYTGNLQPQYMFNPLKLSAEKAPMSRNTMPGYTSFWSCQAGIRLSF